MTKIKNSKKGMAKKTLSISLAVAMLATSNVPVWAAEFTDGTEAAFTSEIEAPVVEAEAPVAEVEEPVVEDAEEVVAATADSRFQNVSVSQNGWASSVSVSGKLLDSGLVNELTGFNYQWMVGNGKGGYQAISNIATGNSLTGLDRKFIPGKDNFGKELFLHIWVQDRGNDNIEDWISAGTVGKENLNNMNAGSETNYWLGDNGVWDDAVHGFKYEYSKGEIKPSVETLKLTLENGVTLKKDDFEISYTHAKGNFVDADSECEVVATPKDQDYYEGILTQKYRITERVYKAGDIRVENLEKTYEYTGKGITPEKSDIVVKETTTNTVYNSEKVIDKVWNDGDSNVGTHRIGVSLLDVPNYVQNSLPKKGVTTGADARLDAYYQIVARDLSKCTVEIDGISLDEVTIGTIADEKVKGKVHIYDASGKELDLVCGTDYEVVLVKDVPNVNGTYDALVKAKGANAKESVSTTLTVTTFDFDDYYFTKDAGTDHTSQLTAAVDYTGENVTKDLSDFRFGYWDYKYNKFMPLSKDEDYKISVTGVNAGENQGRIIIEGLRSFTGAKKVIRFNINAANVADNNDVLVTSGVVFDRGNTKASDYAPAVTVKAHQKKDCTGKTFTLEEGKDYTVKYAFKTRNEIGAKIITTVTITNPNFKGDKTVITRETTITRKQLSGCTINVLGSYTYTGAAIIPEIEVKDGNEVLVKDVDYKVYAKNNVNVGTATVYINGVDENDDGDGIYDPTSSASQSFEITPADAKDVEVVFAGGNTGVKYNGKALKPTIVAVTLNGNDVTQQFDISYPGTYVNVGTGMVTLTPVKDNKNFVGVKDATFEITARELTGTLTVYDKDGQKYTVKNGVMYDVKGNKVVFDYDAEEQFFADATFVPNGAYAKYVTENDYEIKYVDNVYGGTGYIYVAGKGNFAGTETITDAENNIINSVVAGTDYKFDINTYKFKEQHVVIGDAEYAAGQSVKPNVTVTVFGNKLIEGKDYVLEYANRTELTTGKTQKVAVKGIKAFAGSYVEGYFAVVKRDMANTDITITERSNGTYDVVVKNSGVVVPTSEYTLTENGNSVTVTAKEDSKYYTGSQTKEVQVIEAVKPEAPVIANVNVTGNKANVVLTDSDDGATGYDYVISRDRYCTESKAYDDVNKNILNTNTTFTYVQSGVYYAYCHSWVRDENGQKVFSDWSNAFPFVISAVTPDTPKILSVSVKGSTVTVKYTQTANASGYDVVLGSEVKRVAGEKRPINYGTLVEKNLKGDTVTATFNNVPAGTYYAGLHAFNRTAEDGKKVFSPWSAAKTVTVK